MAEKSTKQRMANIYRTLNSEKRLLEMKLRNGKVDAEMRIEEIESALEDLEYILNKNLKSTSEEVEAIAYKYRNHEDENIQKMAMSLISQSEKSGNELYGRIVHKGGGHK